MIEEKKENKYSNDNPANAKKNLCLVKIRNVIKIYIYSKPELKKYYDFTYHAQEHRLDLILDECIERVKYGKTYESSKLLPKSTFNDAFQKLNKRGILKKTYMELLKIYFEKGPNGKLRYRFKDSTCIVNKCGSDKVAYNKHKKRKVTNVSTETESKGIIIFSSTNKGNEHDSKIFIKDLKIDYLVDDDLLERFSKYYIADSGYHSKEIIKNLEERDLVPIIKGNKRNIKDEQKLKELEFTKYEQNIYDKRFVIESTNSHIKSFKLVQTRMDCKSINFEGSLFIAYMNKVLKHI